MRVAVTLEQCWHRVPGGIAKAAIEQVKAVETHGGVEQIGVAARHRHEPEAAWQPPIPVRHLPVSRLAMYEGWHYLGWPKVEQATGPIDVIHATGTAVPPRSVPLVVTVHDLAVLHNPERFTRRGVSFIRRALKLTAERADLVLCSSEATLSDCEVEGFDPERLRLVPLGVDQSKATAEDVDEVRQRYGLDGRYVLFVGTLEPRKNLPGLVRAFGHLMAEHRYHDVRLVLAGPDGWGEEIEGLLAPLGDTVQKLGFVPEADLRALYAGAEVFCYPSLLEGFGLPVLEAMVQGTPVVTSAGTATEELVRQGGGIAVSPRDYRAIAEALAEVLDDSEHARAMGATGAAVAADYTWQHTAELCVSAYRELA